MYLQTVGRFWKNLHLLVLLAEGSITLTAPLLKKHNKLQLFSVIKAHRCATSVSKPEEWWIDDSKQLSCLILVVSKFARSFHGFAYFIRLILKRGLRAFTSFKPRYYYGNWGILEILWELASFLLDPRAEYSFSTPSSRSRCFPCQIHWV